jgi:16S rRNA (cytosine1402-N4)-methyltransferase
VSELGRADAFDHRPVLLDAIVEVMRPVPPGVILDATLGGGGHSDGLLTARTDITILGVDRDGRALAAATARLERFGARVMTYRSRFDDLELAMNAHSLSVLSGALFDLGVSSPQLDVADRGFSHRQDGPLDMRMDDRQPWNAADVVNGYPQRQLADVIRRYGDERFADRIASAIVARRPIESTVQLAEVVTTAIPAAARRTGGHPAKRTFQAIRIEVNGELDAIGPAVTAALRRTVEGGRIAVLAYHSGEDRLVKEAFRLAETGGCACPSDLPCACEAIQTVRVIRAPKAADATEQTLNRRARSARLRVVERVAPVARRGVAMGAGQHNAAGKRGRR